MNTVLSFILLAAKKLGEISKSQLLQLYESMLKFGEST